MVGPMIHPAIMKHCLMQYPIPSVSIELLMVTQIAFVSRSLADALRRLPSGDDHHYDLPLVLHHAHVREAMHDAVSPEPTRMPTPTDGQDIRRNANVWISVRTSASTHE